MRPSFTGGLGWASVDLPITGGENKFAWNAGFGLEFPVGPLTIDISPRLLVIGLALQHIRGGGVRSVAQLLEDRIEIVEADVAPGSRIAKGTLAEIKLPRGVLVAALRRGDHLMVPRGADRAEPGDRVLLITTTENASKLAGFLAE